MIYKRKKNEKVESKLSRIISEMRWREEREERKMNLRSDKQLTVRGEQRKKYEIFEKE